MLAHQNLIFRNMEHKIDFDQFVSKEKGKVATIRQDQTIVLSIAGSHMYGMNTPESDIDYLGVFMPTKEQLLLNTFPRQVKLPKETGLDCQMWSLHYFLELACQGETMATDLLHSPYSCWKIFNNCIWNELVNNRHLFFTKGMKAFVSYARKQAAKYGIKGTRIKTLETVIKRLDDLYKALDTPKLTLRDIWESLPEPEHVYFIDAEPYRMYQVNGTKYLETVKVTYALDGLRKQLTEYGERAIKAKENDGVDWKAVSHALRTCDQVYSILRFGDYTYPLSNVGFHKSVKLGRQDFTTVVQPVLEDSIRDVEELIEKSDLPDEVDREFWKDWLLNTLKFHVLLERI